MQAKNWIRRNFRVGGNLHSSAPAVDGAVENIPVVICPGNLGRACRWVPIHSEKMGWNRTKPMGVPELVLGCTVCNGGPDALGDPRGGGGTNPWLAKNSLLPKDAHVPKAVRTLYYAALRYGSKGPGETIGAHDKKGQEKHMGAEKMDGTVFVRAAGVVSDTLGWIAYGGTEGDWDRSALGWEAAWEEQEKARFLDK
ncbi:hypothetical protein C8J57DRAFT_1243864 [Mycena rebaudengoi]|nr:hypothetical protein C8J57DRAFT_1243864 [Mycena rebaudengoi]